MPEPSCPSRDELESGVRGDLAPPQVEQLAKHLESCPHCEQTVQALCSEETVGPGANPLLEQVRRKAPEPEAQPSEIRKSLLDVANRPTMSFMGGAGSAVDALDFLAPPQEPDEIGRLGQYRVLKILGQGGMGMVLLAHDPNLDRRVALKIMLPKIAADEAAKQRFLREARTAAKVKSDHIVTIYQVGEDRGVPFLAMEFLQGAALDKYLSGGRKLTVPQILRIAREVARGLADAHEHGLIHRDIKPANIWLDKVHNGRAIILDFGLARYDADAHLTQSGAVVGTPAFMAPEQARGEKVDARADLFSFGCVLYRLCANELPFKGTSTMAVLTELATVDPPPPATLNKEIPPGLSNLIEDLLRKDVAKRPGSAREVLNLLVEITRAPSMPSPAPPTAAATTTVTPAREATVVAPPKPSPPSPKPAPPDANPFADSPPPAPPPQPSLVDAIAQGRTDLKPKPSPKKAPVKKEKQVAKKSSPPLAWIAAGLGGLLLFAGIIFFWPTPDGVVRFEIDDPEIQVTIDKNGPVITGADVRPISLRPGAHGLTITRGDFTFDAKSFQINKADKAVLKVDWLPGKVQVLHDGKLLDAKDLPKTAVAAQSPPKPSTPPAAPAIPPPVVSTESASWTSLFDGRSLAGWTPIGFNGWSVSDGVLVGVTTAPNKIGWLMSDREFRDFELEMDYKVAPESNSGVFLRAWPEGGVSGGEFIEVQILDTSSPKFGAATGKTAAGAVFGQIAPAPAPNSSPNQWHSLRIHLAGEQAQVTVDGVRCVDGLLTKSPRPVGRIGLQLYPNHIEFRSIRIRDLSVVDGLNRMALSGWEGLSNVWSANDGAIVGKTPPEGLKANTFLCTKKKYRDFELSCKVKLSPDSANSGVQFRSLISNRETYSMTGPQADIGAGFWGSLYGENFGGMLKKGDAASVKQNDFNDFFVRCIGKHVTIKVNDQTTVDADFATLPDDGLIGLQLHAGNPAEVAFRDVQLKELDSVAIEAPGATTLPATPAPSKPQWISLFNGMNLDGWQMDGGEPGTWTVRDGVIVATAASGRQESWLLSTKDFGDCIVAFEYSSVSTVNSGFAFRAVPGEKTSSGAETFATHPQVEIFGRRMGGKTGTFIAGLNPIVQQAAIAAEKHNDGEGNWNDMEVEVRGQQLTVRLNGTQVLSAGLDALIAKGANYPGLKRRAGRIGFQRMSGGRIRFRNIRIQELGGAP